MVGRLFRVARPDDWTGVLARLAVVIAFVLLAVLVPLVRLPPAWIALAGGIALVVRLVILIGVMLVLWGARTLLVARLPRAAVLLGRSIRFHDGTRRRAVLIEDIAALHVEQRPPPQHEIFVIEQRNGAEHDLCPTHWGGAPALHRALERRVAAAHRRRARAARSRPSAAAVATGRPSASAEPNGQQQHQPGR
ncbi:MAG: hypothetical protein AAGF11_39610 [Myxococcota bacterium]